MQGRTIIVTGGFGTLGQAVSDAFAKAGAKVARVDFQSAPGDGFAGLDIGNVDGADPQQAERAAARVVAEFGAPDVLVNVAGGFMWQTLAQGDPAGWESMFRMNALTCLNMTRAVLPRMMGGADKRIVNVGAFAANRAAAGMGAYAASKSAVARLTEALAEEVVDEDITVNAVLPTILDTPTNRADMPDADYRRWVAPAAVADVILFLASPAARAINGALIPIGRGTPA